MNIYLASPGDDANSIMVEEFIRNFDHLLVNKYEGADAMIVLVTDQSADASIDVEHYCMSVIDEGITPQILVLYDVETGLSHQLRQLVNDNDYIVTVCFDNPQEILENILTFLECI